jgi:hypothetical protein
MTGLIALLALACSSGGMDRQPSGDSATSVPWTEDTADVDTGSDDSGTSDSGAGSTIVDGDLDGWLAGDDCDDSDSAIHPGAIELCNGVDDDCNAVADDGLPTFTVYVDADSDGYGDGTAYTACDVPTGTTTVPGDCDDTLPDVHPGGTEVCNDGLDSDCDGAPGPTCTLRTDSIEHGAWSGMGDGAGDELGTFVTLSGDLDGDGTNDPIVLAPAASGVLGTHTTLGGAVYAFLDPLANPYVSASDASVTYFAEDSADLDYGAVLASDMDGDGYDDLAVGAPGIDVNDGAVQLFWGPFHSGDAFWSELPDEVIATSDAESHLGTTVASAGDIDGDGNADLLVGAARANTITESHAGAAYVLSGPITAGADVTKDAIASMYGNATQGGLYSETVAGDVNADGVSDLVMAFPWMTSQGQFRAGIVAVHYGPLSGQSSISAADVTIEGGEPAGQLGWSSLVAPDQDGDGYGELVVGADGVTDGKLSGAVYLWNGDLGGPTTVEPASADVVWVGGGPADRTGAAVATGDLNGDGVPDFLIGAPDVAGPYADGQVYVDYGPVSGSIVIDRTDAGFEGWRDQIGSALATGDVNGDGCDDFLAGGPVSPTAGTDAGRAYLWLGIGM